MTEPSDNPVLRVTGLAKVFREGDLNVEVLKGVYLRLLRGERVAMREALRQDARYQPYLEDEAWLVNSEVLEACDRLSVYLCASLGSPFAVSGRTPGGGQERIEFERADGMRGGCSRGRWREPACGSRSRDAGCRASASARPRSSGRPWLARRSSA